MEAVVKAAKEKGIPIRIGVNAGSLERHLLEKYGYPTADAMVESALHHIKILEDLDFHDIIVSMKASDVHLAVEAYDKASQAFDYPLHLGITESGTLFAGTVKSAAGIGVLLNMGIGNTLRISLSADPVEEVKVARELLKSFGLAANAATLISCPTCGRIEIDLISIANEVEEYISSIKAPIKVAVLGCAVNGPGEAREADIGIAGARGEGLLFMKGEIVRKVPEETMVEELKKEIDKLAEEHYAKQREAQRINLKNRLLFRVGFIFYKSGVKIRVERTDIAPMAIAQIPNVLRPFTIAIMPDIIPIGPKRSGTKNKDVMAKTMPIVPIPFPELFSKSSWLSSIESAANSDAYSSSKF
ncbi:1-hydroxy-2-methyl-2-(E)-butenyl 4-diphosphate synthase [Bacillus sp. JCM 19047]|nr:1-hydroxy-2-methyl-2-(E)-butenyl 4-diphosphate synthase [Bacillus sp. JCM 19047]